MNKAERLKNLIIKIETSKLESLKAVEYSTGYFDCLKDVIDQKITEFNNVMTIKYDGIIRQKVYDEILPLLISMSKDGTETVHDEPAEHPSIRAQNFLNRINSLDLICQLRAESNAIEYYNNVLKLHEAALEDSNGDSVVRMDLLRLKDWIKKYIIWANKWHFDNYENGDDITDVEELKERWPPPAKAPKLKIFEEIN